MLNTVTIWIPDSSEYLTLWVSGIQMVLPMTWPTIQILDILDYKQAFINQVFRPPFKYQTTWQLDFINELITLHDHELILKYMAILTSQSKNERGKFSLINWDLNSWSPGTEIQCPTNELCWPKFWYILYGRGSNQNQSLFYSPYRRKDCEQVF